MNKKSVNFRDLTQDIEQDIHSNEPILNNFIQGRGRESLRDRLTGLLPIMLAVYIPTLLILVLVRQQNKVPIFHLMGDPAKIADWPFYIGMVTKFGILLWCATAAICLFTSLYLKPLNPSLKHQRFLLASGVITTILLVDDSFQLHEEVFPTYLGIPEKIFYLGYVIIVALYLAKFHKIIRKTQSLIFLGLALGFFTLSIFLDMRFIIDLVESGVIYDRDRALLENGFKLLGIVSWFTYFSLTCKEQIQQGIQRF